MPSDPSTDLAPDFFAEMVDSVGVGVGIYGADGRYTYVNPSYAALFDVAQSELVGTPLWEIAPDIDADEFDGYWASFGVGETRKAETVHEYNGREVPVATVTTRRSIDGTPYHFGTIKDVSERRARERKIERQNERLENFASVVSHDLRNPVNVAQGYLDILREDIDRDELRLVENALDRMDVLITELLELARSEDDIGETSPVSISTTATNAWRNVTTGAAALHTPDSDRRVRASESRLQQLFENLFRNAVEHGSTGNQNSMSSGDAIEHAGLDVDVTVGTTSEGFYVEDDGPGIPSTERGRVFETGYTTDESGTGFGLSIVQRVVAGHGWEIRVADGHDGGARFEVTGVSFVG